MAVAVAVLRGLKCSHYMGSHHIILENDSRTVIRKLQETIKDYSATWSITWDVKALIRGFENCCNISFFSDVENSDSRP